MIATAFAKLHSFFTAVRTAWRSEGIHGLTAVCARYQAHLPMLWARFWMRYAGLDRRGRMATRLATWSAPPYYARAYLARLCARGYVSPLATIYHRDLRLGSHVFIDDRVLIFQDNRGGAVELEDGVHLYPDTYIQTGSGGSVTIGAHTHVQSRCQFSAYKSAIQIGCGVAIAPNCAFYPYNHGMAAGVRIEEQPLESKGDIVIGDNAWIGTGAIVLSGVRIGKGAIVGAGSVVTTDVPDDSVAVGIPARVVKKRGEPAAWHEPLTVPQRGQPHPLSGGKRLEDSSLVRYQDNRAG
jgi:acetyltransferase-like isoleucine patch superfamily enzyme